MAWRWAILNYILRNIPQYIQANAGILHYIRSHPLPSEFLAIHYSMMILLFDVMYPLLMKLPLRCARNKRTAIDLL